MKIARLVPLLIIPFLFACFPKKPEIPMTEVPAGPLMRALEQHTLSFAGLTALAEIQAVRKDRKRSLDSVAVVVKGQERFRIEAYGPFGQSLLTALWNGREVVLDTAGERRVLPPNSFILERILGADLDPAELCAILSGNIPGPVAAYRPGLFCTDSGSCVLELRRDDVLLRVHVSSRWESDRFVIPFWEMFRNGRFVYRVRNAFPDSGGAYPVPDRIQVENPDRRTSLTVRYTEYEVNGRIDERLFRASEGIEQ